MHLWIRYPKYERSGKCDLYDLADNFPTNHQSKQDAL
jgi:hypothetical protein